MPLFQSQPKRASHSALSALHTIRWLPPLTLLLITLASLFAVYTVRPNVTVDVGDYYDTPFLPNVGSRDSKITDFHAREVGVTSATPRTFDWALDQTMLTIPGRLNGIWQATIEAAPDQPNRALHSVALMVNNVRVNIVRRTDREMIALVPAELAAAEQLVFKIAPPLNGDPDPPPGMAGRLLLAPAVTYRWSSERSTISLPMLGHGDWIISLYASVRHPDDAPLNAMIYANGHPLAHLPENGPRKLSFLVPKEMVPNGDLELTITADPYRDPRPLGVLIYDLRVSPSGDLPLLPPLSSTVYALVIAMGLYFCLLRITNRSTFSSVLAIGVVLFGAALVANARYPGVWMLPRLAGLAIWSVILLLVLERLLRWIFRKAALTLTSRGLSTMLLIFFVCYWIKASGMLYPYFIGIDVSWHMDKVLQILNGQLGLFYGTNSPLNESTMPTAEWGQNRPVIPYSPWFHMFAVLFTFVPLPLVLTANMFHALLDSSRVLLIWLLGRKLGLSERQSAMASLLYAVTPATYLLLSWGNVPTAFGMWLTLASTTLIVLTYDTLDRPKVFALLTFVLLATMLIYTVMAAFMLLFLGMLVVALWFVDKQRRRSVIALGLSAATALGLSTLIYYGQYIQPIFEQTLPYLMRVGSADTSVGLQNREPFLTYVLNYWPRMDYLRPSGSYGLQLAMPLGLLGLFSFRDWRIRALFGSWLLVALAFLVVGSRISMVDKHLFYTIPAIALGVGWLLGRLWNRGWAARLIIFSFYAFTFATALHLWIYRIISVRQS